MSEASPLISVNKIDHNDPRSVGPAVPGVDLSLGENNGLLVRGENVMLGTGTTGRPRNKC